MKERKTIPFDGILHPLAGQKGDVDQIKSLSYPGTVSRYHSIWAMRLYLVVVPKKARLGGEEYEFLIMMEIVLETKMNE